MDAHLATRALKAMEQPDATAAAHGDRDRPAGHLPPDKALELGRQVHPEVAEVMGERVRGVVPLRRRR